VELKKAWDAPVFDRATSILSLALFLTASPVSAESTGRPESPHGSAAKAVTREELANVLEKLRKSYELFPGDAKLKKQLAAAYAQVGRNQLEQREFDEAAANFDRARELEPDNADFHLGGVSLSMVEALRRCPLRTGAGRLYGGRQAPCCFWDGFVITGNLDGRSRHGEGAP
jgi:Flp pilus assembly protein TadD